MVSEEQRKERLRIGREKNRARRIKRGKEKFIRNRRPRETAPSHSQRLKRGDENKLERKLRLEKVVAIKHLSLAMVTEEERRANLENDSATKWLARPVMGTIFLVITRNLD